MMAHEFGIMQEEPKHGESFQSYTPKKYNCIIVHDDYIYPILQEFRKFDMYWHSIDRPNKGLAYCGITLLPPEASGKLTCIVAKKKGCEQLAELLREAERERKFIIHFGL